MSVWLTCGRVLSVNLPKSQHSPRSRDRRFTIFNPTLFERDIGHSLVGAPRFDDFPHGRPFKSHRLTGHEERINARKVHQAVKQIDRSSGEEG
jgi:hypothetical protein